MVNQLIDFVDNRVFHKCIKLAILAILALLVSLCPLYLHFSSLFVTYGVSAHMKLDINGYNRITFQGPVLF